MSSSNGNGTATAVRSNGSSNGNGNSLPPARTGGNGARPHFAPQTVSAPTAPEALHWDALAPVVTEALGQTLDPRLVSQRKGRGGRKFDYIEGHTAIDQANRIFGFGGWGYELVGDVTLRQIQSMDSRSGEVTSSTAYSAIVKVTVPGAPSRTDVGFQAVTDESADGHETAFKGAVTDALKRALRSFGDRFGNGLYGDPPTSTRNSRPPGPAPESRQQPQPERRSEPQPRRRVVQPTAESASVDERDAANLRAQLIELSTQQGFSEAQVRSAVEAKTGRPLDDLGPDAINPLIASAAEKLEQRQRSQQG